MKQIHVCLVSLTFALAHILMLSVGWLGGKEVGRLIDRFDHWIAFLVLAFIGLKMIKEAFDCKTEADLCRVISFRRVAVLAVATSLDALLVGVALSFVSAPFWLTLWCMAGCVLVTSYIGFFLGSFLGHRFGIAMEIAGGAALLGVGTKVLLSGLGIW